MSKKSKPATTANPVETETERKGRGRKQDGSKFNGPLYPERLDQAQLRRMADFYQANAAQLIQFRRIAREYGCGC